MPDSEQFAVVKIDEDRRLVFGWASVAVQKDGSTVVDSQGDMIDPETLEAAAYRYVLEDGDGNTMHTDTRTARVVESFVATPEKLAKMGIPSDGVSVRWWLGLHVDDDVTWDAVKGKKLLGLSIEGKAERVAA